MPLIRLSDSAEMDRSGVSLKRRGGVGEWRRERKRERKRGEGGRKRGRNCSDMRDLTDSYLVVRDLRGQRLTQDSPCQIRPAPSRVGEIITSYLQPGQGQENKLKSGRREILRQNCKMRRKRKAEKDHEQNVYRLLICTNGVRTRIAV